MLNSYYKSSGIILYLLCDICLSSPMLPSTPQNIVGGDSVRARDGTTCTQGTYTSPTIDFGVTGTQNTNSANNSAPTVINNYYNGTQQTTNSSTGGDVGVYARVVIPLGQDMNRVDCSQLYSLEIERLTIELENLKKAGSSAVTVE